MFRLIVLSLICFTHCKEIISKSESPCKNEEFVVNDTVRISNNSNTATAFVETGFLSWMGEKLILNQFGEFKRSISGFQAKRSRNGLLIRKKTGKYSSVSLVYPEPLGFAQVIFVSLITQDFNYFYLFVIQS